MADKEPFDPTRFSFYELTEDHRDELVRIVREQNPTAHILPEFRECVVGYATEEQDSGEETNASLVYSCKLIITKLAVHNEMEYPDAMVHLAELMENTYVKNGSPLFINDLELEEYDDEEYEEGDLDD